jgi:hypothetical protein
MKKKYLPFLLPLRSVLFLLTFLAGSAAAGKKVSEITNWWSIVATAVVVQYALIKKRTSRGVLFVLSDNCKCLF